MLADLQTIEDSMRASPIFAHPPLPDSGVSVARWRRSDPGPTHMVSYSLSSYTLSLILQPMEVEGWHGDKKVWSGGIQANSLRITPPGVTTRWMSYGQFDFLLLIFSEEMIDRVAGGDADAVRLSLQQLSDPSQRSLRPEYIRDDFAANIGRQMVLALEQSTRFAEHFASGLAYGLVARLLGRCVDAVDQGRKGGIPQAKLKKIRLYILNNIADSITVAELAALAGLSESHFARAFRATVGVSPHQYIMTTRLEMADRLLEDENLSISSIASSCGFNDASHFSRVFRNARGSSPRTHRQHCAGSVPTAGCR